MGMGKNGVGNFFFKGKNCKRLHKELVREEHALHAKSQE